MAVPCPPELVADAIAFYELLGFARVEPPATLVDRTAWLERDGRQVHLLFAAGGTSSLPGHFAVVADDFAQLVAKLRDAGHPVEDRKAHWGAPRVYARDPAGNVVEVMAAPPG